MTLLWRTVDPAKLQPQFRADIEACLGPLPYTYVVTYGFRTHAEQAALYAAYRKGGPRAAPAGMSPHEYGAAIDVVVDGSPTIGGVQPDWDISHDAWTAMFDAVFAHPRLHSGRSFNDSDHIEAVRWKAYR